VHVIIKFVVSHLRVNVGIAHMSCLFGICMETYFMRIREYLTALLFDLPIFTIKFNFLFQSVQYLWL
jgi:hypothetical protein